MSLIFYFPVRIRFLDFIFHYFNPPGFYKNFDEKEISTLKYFIYHRSLPSVFNVIFQPPVPEQVHTKI